jgi:putative Holliday junction resolvase
MNATAPQPIPSGRVAGVDYGRRRIGIAICDAERIISSPHCVCQTTGDRAADAAFFRGLVAEERIVGFVVGLPIHADGSDSAMSVEVERFAAWLGRETGLPVAFQDERSTSREAAGLLAGIGLTRARKKDRSDAVAAQIILHSWMEAQAAGGGSLPGPLEG